MKHIDRRESFRHIGRLAGLSTAPRQSPGRAVDKRPVAPVEELVNVLEFEVEAARVLSPILIDGSFRRGTDILKGLALGARAALVGRPAMWGLAAYGGRGVQAVLELLQTELARNMAASGRPKIEMIDSSLVRWDSR